MKFYSGGHIREESKIKSTLKNLGVKNVKKTYNEDLYGQPIVEFSFESPLNKKQMMRKSPNDISIWWDI